MVIWSLSNTSTSSRWLPAGNRWKQHSSPQNGVSERLTVRLLCFSRPSLEHGRHVKLGSVAQVWLRADGQENDELFYAYSARWGRTSGGSQTPTDVASSVHDR